jgi:hypothetical protein
MNSDYSKYPSEFTFEGERYVLRRESVWLRRYLSESGKFHVVPRLLDGSFDESLWRTLDPSRLSPDEKNDAGLAIGVSGRTDLPEAWLKLAAEKKLFSI